MEKIEHATVPTNGINMHVASIGAGPPVLFLHGFPELWYSWRHQLLSLSSLGYRCIAPDLRGFGDTDAPPSPTSYTALHIVGDLTELTFDQAGHSDSLSNLTRLSRLGLFRNSFSGAIPKSIGSPSNLEELFLDNDKDEFEQVLSVNLSRSIFGD